MTKLLILVLFAFSTLVAAQFELVPSSTIEYTASDASGSWSGRAPVAGLELTLDPEDVRAARLSVTLQPGAFDSGNFIRDANARIVVFETGQYPEIRFELMRAQTQTNRLNDSETKTVELSGTLTMHGVTKDVETVATVSRAGRTITATGAFTVQLSDYGMKRPSFFGVSVDDTVRVAFDIQVQRPP